MQTATVLDLNYVISLAIVVIGFFIVRTLRSIDANQKALFDRVKAVEEKVNHLEGEHEAWTQMGGHKKMRLRCEEETG